MKIKDLKNKIRFLSDDTEIVTHGYEGGFSIVEFCEEIEIVANVNDPGSSIYGVHDEISRYGLDLEYHKKPAPMNIQKVLLIADKRDGRGSGV